MSFQFAMTNDAAEPRAAAARLREMRNVLLRPIVIGLVCGLIGIYAATVGILVLMHARWIIAGTLTLGQTALLGLGLIAGAKSRKNDRRTDLRRACLEGIAAGTVSGLILSSLLMAMTLFSWRSVFIALSPALRQMLSLGLGPGLASGMLVLCGACAGLIGALWRCLAPRWRRSILMAGVAIVVTGAMQQLLLVILQRFPSLAPIRDFLFTWDGLTGRGAAAIGLSTFLLGVTSPAVVATVTLRQPSLYRWSSRHRQPLRFGLLLFVLGLLPALAGAYIGQVLMMVGLYTLMGMGLNIEVGLAGLLDLGFVAFFAVGAYATALLTAAGPLALAAYTHLPSLSFWQAIPIAVLLSVIVGVLFGIPVLGVRGDYLAIATLGLGEIVRVIVLSDFAAPFLGGAQGVLQIPKPSLATIELGDPTALFYLTLGCSALAAYVAWKLQRSHLGRAWTALRDDEDVAQALGINLVRSKLLAYGLGAAFAGLAGAIFATMLGSVYPNSFTLQVSINVLALIVIGGAGSIQGVVVGALLLVGLPELFREFGEYRFLFYGIALIAIMILRPDGLWPVKSATQTPSGGR